MTSPAGPRASASGPSAALPPAVAVVGFSKTGKTELICRLVPVLAARGLKVAVLKHSRHPDLTLDTPGTDTWRYRRAGAESVALAAPGVFHLTRSYLGEPPLEEALAAVGRGADLILVEGYKSGPLPKVAVLEPGAQGAVPDFPNLIALVSERPVNTSLPVFQPQQVEELGQWLYDGFIRN